MSVVVVATIKPLPERRARVAAALRDLVRTAHAEAGVERFALLEGAVDFVIIEKWVDQAAVDAHVASPLTDELADVVATCLRESPDHVYLTPLPEGDSRLGAV